MDLIVHPQVHRRHPELADEDVKTAFCNIFARIHRADGECVGVGMDGHRRLVELVFRECEGVMVVYHAFTPPTRNHGRTRDAEGMGDVMTRHARQVSEVAIDALLGMDEAELDARGQAYEDDRVAFGATDEVRTGSPMGCAGTRREAFVIDPADFQGVRELAARRGCRKSDIYREAVRQYLERELAAAS